jgi:alpha-amylase
MAAGEYCNIIDSCATKITVGSDGSAHITISDPDNPVVAFCVGCDGSGVTVDPCN